ncbi:MAG: B12-binding domain-containing radical SAM protein [Deltaproteobacteria bacterium]|nr:B12-binding domain-containing radical SAM protein [Deltaproteobacteria bacterium]
MRIAIIATYTHPTRLPGAEPSIMQSGVPELIAGLCPDGAHIELYNEKDGPVPLDGDWDVVFLSYLHAYYEHTKVLSALLRRRGVKTVAGGRHATHFTEDALQHFDVVVTGEPERAIPALFADLEAGQLQRVYAGGEGPPSAIRPYRYDLIDRSRSRFRLPGVEASRGCPFTCNFCVLTGHERYRMRPIPEVIADITTRMTWNKALFGVMDRVFIFYDNNLGGNKTYLRELCAALRPHKLIWGCSLTFNILKDTELLRQMAAAGCRYIYTGLESLNPASIEAMNKGQNKLSEVQDIIHGAARLGILVSFGLLVGTDGDTSDYLEKLPALLLNLRFFSVTFVGIVCPYPETSMFETVQREGRLLPGTISRDYDGYTVCHRPTHLHPTEVAEHYQRICKAVGDWRNVGRHWLDKLTESDLPRYASTIAVSGLEIASVKRALANPKRRYIAGLDPIEAWDAAQMSTLGIEPQRLS